MKEVKGDRINFEMKSPLGKTVKGEILIIDNMAMYKYNNNIYSNYEVV